MCGFAFIASMGRSYAQVEYLLFPRTRLCSLVLTFYDAGPNELSVVDVKAVVDVFGAGGIPKGECEYLIPSLHGPQHADRHIILLNV